MKGMFLSALSIRSLRSWNSWSVVVLQQHVREHHASRAVARDEITRDRSTPSWLPGSLRRPMTLTSNVHLSVPWSATDPTDTTSASISTTWTSENTSQSRRRPKIPGGMPIKPKVLVNEPNWLRVRAGPLNDRTERTYSTASTTIQHVTPISGQ